MTVMVFQSPGPDKIHGHMVQYKVLPEAEVDAALAEGWFMTAIEAGEAKLAADKAEQDKLESEADDKAAVTREEIEAKLTELGVNFDRRLGTKKLAALVEETLKQRTE